MSCVTAIRFNLTADIMHQASVTDQPGDPTEYGEWVESQDPLTGDIVRVWVPATPDDPSTPDVNEMTYDKTKCLVRGIIVGGVRAAGTIENWDDIYKNTEMVNMWFPATKIITQRDRIFNIRNSKGQVMWKEEETGVGGVFKSTVFDVLGVTPILDPFGNHIENYALLEKAEVQ